MTQNNELRGVGLFDSDAGDDLRSDEQIKSEIERTVQQLLRVQRSNPDHYRVEAKVKNGRVELSGELPDRGTRRLLIQFASDLPSVKSVECKDLTPTSLLD